MTTVLTQKERVELKSSTLSWSGRRDSNSRLLVPLLSGKATCNSIVLVLVCNIEIDGIVWHNHTKDSIRDKKLEEHGYSVYRFPVGKHRDLVQRVKNFLNDKGLIN